MTPMKVLEKLSRLPPTIDYVGYTFSLQLRCDTYNNIWLGYYLVGCHSRKRYKRQAYTLYGIWAEKERVVVSSVNSNYLFKVLTVDCDLEPIETLIQYLKNNGIEVCNHQPDTVETEYEIINNLQLK